MLSDHGIYDVKIISVKGQLSDHYNPQKKTVNLSESVYNEKNTASAAVAAHECGHAVQHAKGYEWLKMRSILVPMVGITSNLGIWFIIGGAILAQSSPIPDCKNSSRYFLFTLPNVLLLYPFANLPLNI